MSITIQSLGIAADIRAIVAEVGSSILYLVAPGTPADTFDEPGPPELKLTASAFSVHHLNEGQQRYGLGGLYQANYRASIATPEPDLVILPGWFFFLSFSEGKVIESGTVKGVNRKLSSLIELYLHTREPAPFTATSLGITL